MIALGVSVAAALPAFWTRKKGQSDFGLVVLGALTACWFGWRASTSPVADFGETELLLLCIAVGGFVSVRAISGHLVAERILAWGVALLLLASLVVVGIQLVDQTFSPVLQAKAVKVPTAFHFHYNEAANFFIAVSFLAGAFALFGKHHAITRIFWVLLACAGLISVWLTNSRGGVLGAAVGAVIFAATALMTGRRRQAKWFAPALLALPIIGIVIGAFWWMGWQEIQDGRQAGSGIDDLLDNSIRLYLLGVAVSCVGLHPMVGGGSHSFSWECFRFWENQTQGAGGARPELVHNELMQAATDYGLIGVGLLLALLIVLTLATILRILFEEREATSDQRDAWRIGGLAALAGMLVQSSFSFVFHVIPGVLLLGICLGLLSRATEGPNSLQAKCNRVLLTAAGLASLWFLFPGGWKGTQVTRILWPTYFSKQLAITDESRLDALGQALAIWPQSKFFQERATIHQEAAGRLTGQPGFQEAAELAIENYEEGSRLHPFEPSLVINRANLLSHLERNKEAEKAFALALHLQGGMEPGFRGQFSLASHYFRKGLRLFDPEEPDEALEALELAALAIEKAVEATPPSIINVDGRTMRISIHESLGTGRELSGDREGALQAYDFASTIPTGTRAHYRAGVLVGKMAVEAWSKRQPSEALTYFIEARRRIGQAGNQLPQGVSASDRVEYLDYLDRTIAFLKGAKVEPK